MNPRLFVAPCAREIVEAVKQLCHEIPLGLIASTAQVNVGGGYSGYTTMSLKEAVSGLPIYLQRDHLGKGDTESSGAVMEVMRTDDTSGWNGVFLDTNRVHLVQYALQQTKLDLEVGCGEDVDADYQTRIENAFWACNVIKDDARRIRWASMPIGCLIMRDLTNTDWVDESRIIEQVRSKGPLLRGHNCDYASATTLRRLGQLGVAGINVAPALGVAVTSVYLRHTPSDAWKARVFAERKWERWSTPEFAINAGGHYHLEQLDESFRSKHFSEAVEEVKERMRNIYVAFNNG